MSNKESKKDGLDLDFSEMNGDQSEKEPLKVVKPRSGWDEKKKKKVKRKKLDDPIFCIPTEDGWINRTITDCTAEEFVIWFQHVHPGVECTPEDFPSRSDKMQAFKYLLSHNIITKFKDKDHARTKH